LVRNDRADFFPFFFDVGNLADELDYWNYKKAHLSEIRNQFDDRWDAKERLDAKLEVKERKADNSFVHVVFIRNQRQFNKRIIKFTSELLDNAFTICGMLFLFRFCSWFQFPICI
jgi:hypothetical protein